MDFRLDFRRVEGISSGLTEDSFKKNFWFSLFSGTGTRCLLRTLGLREKFIRDGFEHFLFIGPKGFLKFFFFKFASLGDDSEGMLSDKVVL